VVFIEQEQADFKRMISSARFLLIVHGGGLVVTPP
jgi:hypothetical protein